MRESDFDLNVVVLGTNIIMGKINQFRYDNYYTLYHTIHSTQLLSRAEEASFQGRGISMHVIHMSGDFLHPKQEHVNKH